jgi:TPR repeat protein
MEGAGVAHDLADAARNFRLAADQGIAVAQSWCGYLSECGQGAKRDMAEAVRLYRAASAQGDVRALARLAVCLEKGRGVAQSEADALVSYAAASELGGAATLFAYGAHTLDAIGERSAPEVFTLQLAVGDLALAARLGHAGAVEKLASIASMRELVSACCLGCGATRVLRLCTRCRVAKFCDGECTRRSWPIHRPVCTQWQADARAPTEE